MPRDEETAPQGQRSPGEATTSGHQATGTTDLSGTGRRCCASSQQVSRWLVNEFVGPTLAAAGSWPMAGSVAWHELPDDDARKIAALYDAARHHILRVETCQAAMAAAGEEIAAAANWSALAQGLLAQRRWYAERPWLKWRVES